MKTLTTKAFKTVATKARSVKGWNAFFAFALIATMAAAPGQLAFASGGGRSAEVTFTKWITAFPNMAGVVGGDIGQGTFAGEIVTIGTVGNITSIEAFYHMYGSQHSFTAHVYVTQNNVTNQAEITGLVTDGWLKGAHVEGAYTVYPNDTCPIATPGNSVPGNLCFQGSLELRSGFGQ